MIAYHVPGLERVVWASLEERGLGRVLERGAVACSPGHVVEGVRGGVFCPAAQAMSPRVVSAVRWESLQGVTGRAEHEGVSFGVLGEASEVALRRSRFYGGKPRRLVNGWSVMVPVLAALPGVVVMRGGEMFRECADPEALRAQRMMAEARAEALRAQDMIRDAAGRAVGMRFSVPLIPFCEAVLAINYRATWAEWSLLRCIQEDDAQAIWRIAADAEGQEATEAGKNPSGPSSADG